MRNFPVIKTLNITNNCAGKEQKSSKPGYKREKQQARIQTRKAANQDTNEKSSKPGYNLHQTRLSSKPGYALPGYRQRKSVANCKQIFKNLSLKMM